MKVEKYYQQIIISTRYKTFLMKYKLYTPWIQMCITFNEKGECTKSDRPLSNNPGDSQIQDKLASWKQKGPVIVGFKIIRFTYSWLLNSLGCIILYKIGKNRKYSKSL